MATEIDASLTRAHESVGLSENATEEQPVNEIGVCTANIDVAFPTRRSTRRKQIRCSQINTSKRVAVQSMSTVWEPLKCSTV